MSSNWDDPKDMLTRAQMARTHGNQELAYQLYARASELNPQDARAWQGRADTAVSADETLVSYGYAYALNAESAQLARTLDAAIAQRMQDATKKDAPLLAAMGQELAEVGLTERARLLLTRAAELEPSSTDALVWLAALASDEQEQLDYLNRALATNPRDPRARAGLLTVKLPPPPPTAPPAPPHAEAAVETPTAPNAPLAETTSETAPMERLRKLRANVPPTEAKPAHVPTAHETFRPAATQGDTRMRMLLLILLALVALFAIAGVVLMQLQ